MPSLTATELTACLRERGVELSAQGGRLRFHAPPGVLTPELRNEVVRRKDEIIACLERREDAGRAFAKLLEPIRIGNLQLRNRIVMSPMEVDFGARDGTVTERVVDYYAERARGGVGLVVIEATCVDAPQGRLSPHQLRADDDRFIPGLRRLARGVRGAGAGVVLQLHHAGRRASSALTGCPPVGPSAIADPPGEMPRELTREEIATISTRFGQAARRAMMAGFDGVQIHAAHGYLMAQFLSPLANRRRDEYGGSLENRARFLLASVAAIRQRAGRSFPIFCRLSAADCEVKGERICPHPDGLTPAEGQRVAQLLEAAGVVAIDTSVTFVGPARIHPMSWPEGLLAPLAAALKDAVSIPVSVTGRIPPELGESLLREGKVDLVTMGRALIADPHLPRKIAENRPRDVTPCLCCQLCLDPLLRQPGAICAVNPALGREGDPGLAPAPTRRRIVVVGGGAAGMEAARTAAARGHEVHLFERQEALGGQLLVASEPPAVHDALDRFRRYLSNQLDQLGVDVRLGERFTAACLERWQPDLLVLATGAEPMAPELPGAGEGRTLSARAALDGAPTGQRVAVVGSERIGCETALWLAARGNEVNLLGRRPDPAMEVTAEVRNFLLWALEEHKITVITGAEVEAIEAAGVRFRNRDGECRTLDVDSVVLATGGRPDDELLAPLERGAPRAVRVGNCKRPRGIREAVEEGYLAALAI